LIFFGLSISGQKLAATERRDEKVFQIKVKNSTFDEKNKLSLFVAKCAYVFLPCSLNEFVRF